MITQLAADAPKWTDIVSALAALGSGVIAVLALAAAVWAGRAAWRTNQQQADQLRRLAERERSHSATNFGLWGERELGTPQFYIFYSNAGSLPVYDITATMTSSFEDGDRLVIFTDEVIPALGPSPRPVSIERLGDLAHEHVQILVAHRYGADDELKMDGIFDRTVISYTFRDSEGQRWRRSTDGRLAEIR